MSNLIDISFSVVIPTLGSRPVALHQAVRNATEQSFPPIEVIVVMNGPTDIELPDLGQASIVRAPAGLGTAQSRNLGASRASASHIAFLDDDDLWARDYLCAANRGFKRSDSISALVGVLEIVEKGQLLTLKNPEGLLEIDTLLLRNPGVTGSNLVVDRNKFLASSGYRSALKSGADKSLIIDLLLAGCAVAVEPAMISIRRVDWIGSLSRGQIAAAKIQFLATFWYLMSFKIRVRVLVQAAILWCLKPKR